MTALGSGSAVVGGCIVGHQCNRCWSLHAWRDGAWLLLFFPSVIHPSRMAQGRGSPASQSGVAANGEHSPARPLRGRWTRGRAEP